MKFIKLLVLNDYSIYYENEKAREYPNFSYTVSPLENASPFWKVVSKIYWSKFIPSFLKKILLFKLPVLVWYFVIFNKKLRKINEINGGSETCLMFSSMRRQLFFLDAIKLFKKRHPYVKIVFFFEDKIDFYKQHQCFNLKKIEKCFDVIFSYNDLDVQCYGFYKTPTLLIPYLQIDNELDVEYSDLFFIGYAKDRYDKLIKLYEECLKIGLKCDFTINGVKTSEQKYPGAIKYNETISYSEVVKRCLKTKCIVNIAQGGAEGLTIRDIEAISMNKVLLTNSRWIEKNDMYNPNKVIFLENFSTEWKKISDVSRFFWNNKEKYNVANYFSTLEQIIKES